MNTSACAAPRGKTFWDRVKQQKVLILMTIPFLVHVIIFRYVPIWGWLMAFQNYWPGKSILQQTWVGLENFKLLFDDPVFYQVLRNTLAMSVIKLAMGTVSSIILALMLNEVRIMWFKKSVQTISYLPHFISWVVAANLVRDALSTDGGIINEVLMRLHIIKQPIMFLGIPALFWWIIGVSHVWKEVGWGAIIYLAAIAAIDPTLYESAMIDGAGRLKQMWYITLPSIRPTISVLLIMNLGWVLSAGFEQQYLLQNGRVIDYARVFTIYELDYGIKMMRYSFATAVGIFRSVVSLILVFSANQLAKRWGQERLV
ncbi:MAG TPA: sugar ABC transporter permease [Firmicutes bacterium]|jgi:putative aldouronate transport system permease protein|nr:MAG: protein lplB [Peptococcaceae bacterium 1109]HHT74031.1 sugar ABC transporter permease [Bacillota bacterium]